MVIFIFIMLFIAFSVFVAPIPFRVTAFILPFIIAYPITQMQGFEKLDSIEGVFFTGLMMMFLTLPAACIIALCKRYG